jgi:hypothetical protein
MREDLIIGIYLSKFYPFVIGANFVKQTTAATSYLNVNVSYSKLIKEFPDIEFAPEHFFNLDKGERYYYLGGLIKGEQADYPDKYIMFQELRKEMGDRIDYFHRSNLIPKEMKHKKKYLELEQYIVYK